MPRKYHLLVTSPLGQKIHVTKAYWDYIWTMKHPEVEGQEQKAVATIEKPDIIKLSPVDPEVFLYYKKIEFKYFCIVAKHLNGDGFMITAYITKRFVRGEIVYQLSKAP